MCRMLYLSLQIVKTQQQLIASQVKSMFIVMHNDVVKYAFDFESTTKLIVQQHAVVYGKDALNCMRRAEMPRQELQNTILNTADP